MTARPGSVGFTLIELTVVLAVLGVAAAFVLPAIGRGSETLRLRSEGGRIAALLRDARQQAVTQRQTAHVTLDRARSTVDLALGEGDQARRQLVLPSGFHLSVSGGPESLTFSPRGITRDARWILEGPGGHELAIRVDGVTGRVTVGWAGAS